ncbi:putative oxidoreductase YciK [bacterium HR40]|nr:putative oxidoreductase YciK [bacterium HR40]
MAVLAGRVVLVTGASRGLGAAVAPLLAAQGAHLVLLARTRGGLEETDDAVRQVGGHATLLPLDLADGDAVDRIGPSLWRRFGRLDGLVACAAVLGRSTPVAHGDPDWFELLWRVNVVANARLIRSLEPLLRRSDAGRAVFLTCGFARRPRAYFGHYGASKAALEALVLSWAREIERTPIRAVLFDPGPMATRLRAEVFPTESPTAQPHPAAVAPALLPLLRPDSHSHGVVIEHRPRA